MEGSSEPLKGFRNHFPNPAESEPVPRSTFSGAHQIQMKSRSALEKLSISLSVMFDRSVFNFLSSSFPSSSETRSQNAEQSKMQ
jgi:hypothetical protein